MDKTLNTPALTVLMSVYNGEKHLKEAIDSILGQTFKNFEFIIINDASTDNSLQLIASYTDSRIKLIENNENIGLTKSLNKGIKLAKGKYIARMDADDISLPERLKIQYEYLEKNRDIAVCGTNYEFMHGEKSQYPVNYELLKIKLFQGKNLIAHPSVMFKKECFQKYNLKYDENNKYAQDFKLWVDAIKFVKIVNLPDVLLKYRVHPEQITAHKKKEQNETVKTICIKQLIEFMPTTDDAEIKLHLQFIKEIEANSLNNLTQIQKWVKRLIHRNKIFPLFDNKIFKSELHQSIKRIKGSYFLHHFHKTSKYSLNLIFPYFSLKFKAYRCFSFEANIKFLLKCLIAYKKKM